MDFDEIEIPKEVRPFMMENALETNLGLIKGAIKQYRYGNLHIREYADKYLFIWTKSTHMMIHSDI